jgi:hypothetical protein
MKDLAVSRSDLSKTAHVKAPSPRSMDTEVIVRTFVTVR